MTTRRRRRVETPVGTLLLEAGARGLSRVSWVDEDAVGPQGEAVPLLEEAARQIREYLDRRRARFDLPLAIEGTPFQRAVWEELSRIPYGETRTYGQVAEALGRPGAARAVGQANRANPLALLIPCHRVVARDGLGGYAGSEAKGVRRKGWLLEHEARGRPSARRGEGDLSAGKAAGS